MSFTSLARAGLSLLMGLAAILAPPSAAAALDLGSPLYNAGDEMKRDTPNPAAILSGACRSEVEGSTSTHAKIYLVVPVGADKGFVVDTLDDGTAVVSNFGYVRFKGGKASVEENMGGEGTTERLRLAVQTIADTGLTVARSYGDALNVSTWVNCATAE